MPRPMTTTKLLDLKELLDGPRSRADLDVTPYAIRLAHEAGDITRAGTERTSHVWKLTPKGRRKAKK